MGRSWINLVPDHLALAQEDPSVERGQLVPDEVFIDLDELCPKRIDVAQLGPDPLPAELPSCFKPVSAGHQDVFEGRGLVGDRPQHDRLVKPALVHGGGEGLDPSRVDGAEPVAVVDHDERDEVGRNVLVQGVAAAVPSGLGKRRARCVSARSSASAMIRAYERGLRLAIRSRSLARSASIRAAVRCSGQARSGNAEQLVALREREDAEVDGA